MQAETNIKQLINNNLKCNNFVKKAILKNQTRSDLKKSKKNPGQHNINTILRSFKNFVRSALMQTIN